MQNTKFNQEKLQLQGKRFVFQEHPKVNEAGQKAALEAAKEQEKNDVLGGMSPEQAQQRAMDAITKVEGSLPAKADVSNSDPALAEQLRSINAITDAIKAARNDILAARENLENTAKEVTTATDVAASFRLNSDEYSKQNAGADILSQLKPDDYKTETAADVGTLNTAIANVGTTLEKIDVSLATLDAMIKGLEAVKDPLVQERFKDVLTEMKTSQAGLIASRDSLIKVDDDFSLYKGIKSKEAVDNVAKTRQESGVLQQKLVRAGGNVPPDLQAQADQALAQFRAADALAKAFKSEDLPDTSSVEPAGPDVIQVDLGGNKAPGAVPTGPDVPRV